jgi:hypothetical protein
MATPNAPYGYLGKELIGYAVAKQGQLWAVLAYSAAEVQIGWIEDLSYTGSGQARSKLSKIRDRFKLPVIAYDCQKGMLPFWRKMEQEGVVDQVIPSGETHLYHPKPRVQPSL